MKKSRIIVALIAFICLVIVGLLFIRYEINQQRRITELENRVKMLGDDITDLMTQNKDDANETIVWEEDSINYLAIGNSITKHPICNYWWNEIGMAASDISKDYVHLVANELEHVKGKSCVYAVNFIPWEQQNYDRAECYYIIDSYLSDSIDLVTIQLSENVSDTTTFYEDYLELIEYISEKCPKAQIIIIDDFWNTEKKHEILKQVANEKGLEFVDLSEIKNRSEYQSQIGAIVYDADGNSHEVLHNGVSTHPGNKGMEYYAEQILKYYEP